MPFPHPQIGRLTGLSADSKQRKTKFHIFNFFSCSKQPKNIKQTQPPNFISVILFSGAFKPANQSFKVCTDSVNEDSETQ